MSDQIEFMCERCGDEPEILYGKGTYNGNKDSRFYCSRCYQDVFNENPVLDKHE